MINSICLDKNYSTTRLLIKEKPVLENRFEAVLFLSEREKRKDEGGLQIKGYFKKSYEDKPLISIITVVFNGEKYLEETIKSVINQTYDNVEYIIIDGGSTDDTLNIIERYDNQIDYWISENDHGISDAFNKGIEKSSGFILMLNAGDIFVDNNTLVNVSIELTYPIVSYEVINASGRNIGLAHYKEQTLLTLSRVPHQGTFVHKSVYDSLGFYSTGFKIRMDYEFFSKIVDKIKPKFVHKSIAIFDNSGISSDLKHKFRFEIEGIIIEYLYFNKNIFRILYLPLVRLIKSIIGTAFRKMKLRR